MKILGMGAVELVIVLAVAALLLGPKLLPKLGATVGRTIASFRKGLGADKLLEFDD